MRSADAADPGWSNYDWDYLESLLSESFVAAGGKILVSLEDVHGRPLPRWMADQGMVDTGANPIDTGGNGRAALWRRKTTAALQDSYEAFARRFAGDERIAAVVIGESEVGSRADLDLEDGATVCGNIDELTGYRAQRQGRIYQAAALKEGDPDLMVMVMKLHRGMESGYASNAPGMNDRPGQWGTMGDGGEFFVRMCGSGVFPEVDCVDPESTTAVAPTLRQEYAMANSHPTGTDARSYQWTNSDPGCCRLGDLNPWGYSAWPVVRGFWPGQDGEWKDQPSPQHWVWYNSDEPKNTDSDSALGQLGPDPGGVSPVQFYIPRPAEEIQQSPADSTNADTRTYSDFAEAIDTFGPSGTGAMFRLPPGYLQ